MKIKAPKFMRKFAAKRVSKFIYEEIGINNDIDIGDVSANTKGKNYTIHMEFTIELNKRDYKRVMKKAIKEAISGEI